MEQYTCDFCNKTFKLKQHLTRHQKGAQYCLQLQGKETQLYTCDCGKGYTLKSNLQRHKKVCYKEHSTPDNNQEDLILKVIDKFSEMFKDLMQSQSQQLNGEQRKVVLQGLEAITDEKLREHLEHLSLKFIQDGARGYASFAGEYPLKDKVVCTDKARKKLRYKNEDGELSDNGRVLAQRFFAAISERNKEILNDAYSDLQQKLQEIVLEGRAGEADVTGILTKSTQLQEILIKSQNAAEGRDDEFSQEFLSYLSKIL